MEGSFEYGKDIAVLYGSLRSADRLLNKQSAGSATEEDECATYSQTVSRGVQNAYKGAVTKDNVDQRMHCALLCNVLVTSNIVKKEELSYFDSILDNIPRFSIRIYFAVIEQCDWTKHFIEAIKALPKSIRLAFLRKTQSYTDDSYHTWFCLVSVLAWSVYVEPVQVFRQSEDEILNALSSLQHEAITDGVDDNPDTDAGICTSFSDVLTSCTDYFVTFYSEPASNVMRVRTVCAVRVIVHFFSNFLLPSTYSLQSANHWVSDVNVREECSEDVYSVLISEYECSFDTEDLFSMLKLSESGFLSVLAALLCNEDVQRLLAEERQKYIETSNGYMNTLLTRQGIWDQMTGSLSLFHALEALDACLSAVLQFVPLDDSLKSIKELKHVAEKNRTGGHVIDDGCDRVDDIIKCLEGDPANCAELLAWILNENTLIKDDRVICCLHSQLCLLSHPVIFPKLLREAHRLKDFMPLKELTVKTCTAAPLALQRAMLKYCLTQHGCSGILRTTDFVEQLVERINTICSTPEELEVSEGFVDLCLQDPLRVIEELVRLSVGDGCVKVVCEILKTIRPACDHKTFEEPSKSLLEIEMECSFTAQLQEPSKSNANFVSLVKVLAQNRILDFDVFLHIIVHYIESGGTRNPFPDECFPLKVFTVMCCGISEKYKHPMLLMVAQLLDKACVLLNAKQKELIVDILESCIPNILSSSDNSSEDDEHLKEKLQTLSNMCQVALCGILKKAKLERHHLFQCLSESLSDDLLLQTKEQWEMTCKKLHNQHGGLTVIEIILPYFCVRFSGATWDEWEILFARLAHALCLSKGDSTTMLETVRALTNCVAVCTQFFHVGSWGYFYSCFAKVMKAQLQSGKLSDCEVCNVIRELLLSLSVVPAECHRQGIILLLDVAQLLISDTKDKVTTIIKETLAAAESSTEFVIAVDSLRDKILHQLSHISR